MCLWAMQKIMTFYSLKLLISSRPCKFHCFFNAISSYTKPFKDINENVLFWTSQAKPYMMAIWELRVESFQILIHLPAGVLRSDFFRAGMNSFLAEWRKVLALVSVVKRRIRPTSQTHRDPLIVVCDSLGYNNYNVKIYQEDYF